MPEESGGGRLCPPTRRPVCCWRVPGSRRADGTLQEPQEAAVNPPTAGTRPPQPLSTGALGVLARSRGLGQSLGDTGAQLPGTQQGQGRAHSRVREARGGVPDQAEDSPPLSLGPRRAFPSKGQEAAKQVLR